MILILTISLMAAACGSFHRTPKAASNSLPDTHAQTMLSPADVEELDIEERTGRAQSFHESAIVFDLNEYGKDKRGAFGRPESRGTPAWISGLGFHFQKTSPPIVLSTEQGPNLFRGWAAHVALRLSRHFPERTTAFELTLEGDEKEATKISPKNPSRLTLGFALKNGRPHVDLSTAVVGKKPSHARVRGKARLPTNQVVHLVVSLRGGMLRLFTGTHLIAETRVEDPYQKWRKGELIVGSGRQPGEGPFVGFISELEFADVLPPAYR